MASSLFSGLLFASVYIDDVVMRSQMTEQHVGNIYIVCERIGKAGLQLKLNKCVFGVEEMKIMGYFVCSAGVKTDPKGRKGVEGKGPPVREGIAFFYYVLHLTKAVCERICTVHFPSSLINGR